MSTPEDSPQNDDKSISEYESLVREARNRTKVASKDYIPKCCEILKKEGLPSDKIVRRIKWDFGEIWSTKTIYEAIPDEYKKVIEQSVHPREPILLEQSSSGLIERREKPEPQEQDQQQKRIAALEAELADRTEDINKAIEKNQMLEEALKKSSFSSASDLPQQQEPQQNNRKHEECFMPLPFAEILNKFKLARLIGMAKANGDTAITFKINNEGDLYLP